MNSTNPNQAILFHRAKVANEYAHSNAHHFATLHDIALDKNNSPVIKEGRLMSYDCFINVLKDSVNMRGKKQLELIPETVLAQSGDAIVWYVKGKVRTMLFKQGKHRVKIEVPCPTLIFKVVGGELFLAATRFQRKPISSDILYYAPLMNIDRNNNVCKGSAICPDNTEISSIDGWEDVIFKTYFTHINHDYTLEAGKNTTSTSQLLKFWRSLRGEKSFPNSKLKKQAELTLEQWITQ